MPKRGPKRERDDKVHESIIEERIQRERPCRTLFIRNIKASVMLNPTLVIYGEIPNKDRELTLCDSAPFQYETNSDEVRLQFEEHGEIKTFFDLIANRGMVFVTFVSARHLSAELDDLVW